MVELATQFHRDMIDASREYTKMTGTRPTRFLQMLSDYGAVEAARRLAHSEMPSEGFTRAWEHNCLDLTSEYLMIFAREGLYQALFDEADIKAAKRRLRQYEITGPITK